jgi:hypothetical protein
MGFDLNGFCFTFSSCGRLRQLQTPGGAPLLHQTAQQIELEPGRTYSPSGWDECFPTLDPVGRYPAMGALVASLAHVKCAATQIVQHWSTSDFDVTRRFYSPEAGLLSLRFSAQNRSGARLPFLWASHPLWAVEQLTELALPNGRRLSDFSINHTATKFFVRNHGPVHLQLRDSQLSLTTDQPWWGVWVNRGGWPRQRPAGFACLGIEPTNTAGEVPAGAVLLPGAKFSGEMQVQLR